jgi:hypothetical protein
MAKKGALGALLLVEGRNISGDTASIESMDYRRNMDNITGIDKSAMERLPLVADGEITFTGFFNDATNQQHLTFRGLPTADVNVTFLQSQTLGDQACGLIGKQINYSMTRNADGSLRTGVQVLSNGFPGPDWGQSLTAGVRTDTTGTNGTGVDFGTGSTAFGMVAYLEVLSVTGTSVTVTLQESSDNGGGDAFANITGGAFSAATSGASPQAQRIVTSLTQTVERYIRAVSSGTFSNAQFVVVAKRYATGNAELA